MTGYDSETVSSSIVGELILGDIPEWYVPGGRVFYQNGTLYLYDADESAHDMWALQDESGRNGEFTKESERGDIEVFDLDRIAASVNAEILALAEEL